MRRIATLLAALPGIVTGVNGSAMLFASCALYSAAAQAQQTFTNLVPNPEFRGTFGHTFGTVNGETPTLWRSFAVDTSEVTTDVVPLAANALYPGSPPTNAVRLTVHTFSGQGEGFDHSPTLVTLQEGETYNGTVYLRTDNADNSSQEVSVGLPLFDADGIFLGVAPGTFNPVVTTSWSQYSGPSFTALGPRTTHLSFRLIDDGGDNSILIAMPELEGRKLSNRVRNPGFSGTGGNAVGDTTGPVPDQWRGFAVGGGAITTAIVPLAANALYPGSPPTNAVQLTVDTFGSDQGFDNFDTQFNLEPAGDWMRSEVFLRSANADSSDQSVSVTVATFDENGAFTGQIPDQYSPNVTTDWSYYGNASFPTQPGTFANFAIRLNDDGGDNSVLIAMPRFNAPVIPLLKSGFE